LTAGGLDAAASIPALLARSRRLGRFDADEPGGTPSATTGSDPEPPELDLRSTGGDSSR
jgi:hypothetical protein